MNPPKIKPTVDELKIVLTEKSVLKALHESRTELDPLMNDTYYAARDSFEYGKIAGYEKGKADGKVEGLEECAKLLVGLMQLYYEKDSIPEHVALTHAATTIHNRIKEIK